MKTKLFSALALVAAFAFVSCDNEKKQDPNALTGIEVRPSSINLVPEGTQRLSVVTIPATAEFPEVIEWTSSDEAIATVNERGVVTAVAVGEATVTAKAGEFTGSCLVKVLQQAPIQFTGGIVWDMDTLVFKNEDGTPVIKAITTRDGSETFNCYKAMAELWIMSEGFYFNDQGRLDGAEVGYVAKVYAPMWYGTEYLNPEYGQGVTFSLGTWVVEENASPDSIQTGLAGYISDEAAYFNLMKDGFLAGYNGIMTATTQDEANAALALYQTALQTAPQYFEGAVLSIFEYDADTENNGANAGYYSAYIPDGLIKAAKVDFHGDGASAYMMGVNYASVTLQLLAGDYGLALQYLDEEAGTLALVDEEIHYTDEIIAITGEVPAESPALVATPANVFKEKCPMQAMMIESRMKSDKYSLIKK